MPTVIPDIERVRELQAPYTQQAFVDKCGISRKTLLQGIYAGHRVDIETMKAIAAAFNIDAERLILDDPPDDRLCDRIARLGLWPDLTDALRNIAIMSGVSAMKTFSEDARKFVGLSTAETLLQSIGSDAADIKNYTIPADLDATVAGTRLADLLIRPFADKLGCGVSYLSEESAKHSTIVTAALGETAQRVHPPETFFRNELNVLRILSDPLDGSSNQKRAIPFFASAVCLLVDDQPRVSAIFDPVHNIAYSAALTGSHERPDRQVTASAWTVGSGHAVDLAGARSEIQGEALKKRAIAIHFPRNDRDKRRQMISKLDSLTEAFDSVYAFCAGIPAMVLVSRRGLAAFAVSSTDLHDIAAGAVLCSATKCKVTDWSGEPIRYNRSGKTSLLAADANVHAEVLAILNQ